MFLLVPLHPRLIIITTHLDTHTHSLALKKTHLFIYLDFVKHLQLQMSHMYH